MCPICHIKEREGRRKKDKEKTFQKRYHPRRRWVVERTNSWHNRFRKLFTRYEKKAENYLGLVQSSSIPISTSMLNNFSG